MKTVDYHLFQLFLKKFFVSTFGFLALILHPQLVIAQIQTTPPQTPVMTLGVFHFAYHNLDVVQTSEKDQISVLDKPFQSEIVKISKAIAEFKPTIIAIEKEPLNQIKIDSLYNLYKSGKLEPYKDEIYQLAFRLGKMMEIDRIDCVNDMGRHYDNLLSLFKDSIRLANFSDFINISEDSIYNPRKNRGKVKSITDELMMLNDAERIKQRLGVYLISQFKYEEQEDDFLGVDFETGRWFNRNLRIFRNVQRIPRTSDDRILLIIGAEHLNLLNPFFDVSPEFNLISPIPYLQNSNNL